MKIDLRIVLRHEQRKLYYDGAGGWVAQPSRALTFANAIRALHYCVLNRLQAEVFPVLAGKGRARKQSLIEAPRSYASVSADPFGRRSYE